MQAITCKGDGGSFKLTFRGETTQAIPHNAGIEAVKTALEALITIDHVSVEFSVGNNVCANTADGIG